MIEVDPPSRGMAHALGPGTFLVDADSAAVWSRSFAAASRALVPSITSENARYRFLFAFRACSTRRRIASDREGTSDSWRRHSSIASSVPACQRMPI
jgi:hypothetical protein